MKWRVEGDWRKPFSTYERALRRARDLSKVTKSDLTIWEVDLSGNETPVAEVKWKEENARRKPPGTP